MRGVSVRGAGVPDAARAALCVGGTVAVGWAAGDLGSGLVASLGALTALYGGGRPYRYRARQLAVIAVAFALVVAAGVGAGTEGTAWATVPVVAAVAMAATWLCEALDTGPPGAYMLVLAAATATALPATDPVRAGLLVLGGGMVSLLVHLAGALVRPRGPETAALTAAARAVERAAGSGDAVGSADAERSRDAAVRALHSCWLVLRSDDTAERFQAVALELHQLLARLPDPGLRGEASRLVALAADPPPARVRADDLPLGRPAPGHAARALLRRGSRWRAVVARVGLAALLAGAVGATIGLDHAYWATAAAVLVLCQGLNWADTLDRAGQRLVGTWAGLVLAAALLLLEPDGLWLVLAVTVLQFLVQLTVPRTYAVGALFITPLALAIGTAGRTNDVAGLVLARGVDTLVGCAVGVLVYLLVAPTRASRPETAVDRTLRAVRDLLPHLADGTVDTPAVREARRRLNAMVLELPTVYADAAAAPRRRRREEAARAWPTLVDAQRLGRRTLDACWHPAAASPTDLAAELARIGG